MHAINDKLFNLIISFNLYLSFSTPNFLVNISNWQIKANDFVVNKELKNKVKFNETFLISKKSGFKFKQRDEFKKRLN